MTRAGIRIVGVPYRSGGESVTAVLSQAEAEARLKIRRRQYGGYEDDRASTEKRLGVLDTLSQSYGAAQPGDAL